MRYRNRVRVMPRHKKGTSRTRRRHADRMARLSELFLNTDDARELMDRAAIHVVVYGSTYVRTEWSEDAVIQTILDPETVHK